VKVATTLGINKIRYTGGEPLVMKDIDKLIYETSKLQGIDDIAITTNGILLSDMADDLKKAGLKRVNISLDTLNSEKFKSITRIGNLDKVMKSIDKCLTIGLKPVKINTVLMRGINDTEFEDFLNLTRELPIEIRFIELMPIGEGIEMYEKNKLSFMEMLGLHPELTQIETQKSSTAQLYKLEGAKGNIGFISPVSCKFCGDCNKIRLTSTGTIKQCLHSAEEIDLRKYLNNEEMLTAALKSAIFNKPLEHHLEEESVSRSIKVMSQIGG
ncbi:GTP 3',8-cyclase MoaA, partial [Clostridium sp.]|uniref:GTP 3',8-cyclase MoaA n=1 Tax=Clostridium sp. TaxID=1506 RepID=UPI001A3A67D7